MLVIRLKRIGRSGHAQFRIVVQDVRQSPKSGQVVATLGAFDPHTKAINIDTEKANMYLKNGAQPSDRIAILLKQQGIKLPKWVLVATKKQKPIRNTEKLRKNRTEEVKVADETPAEAEAVADTETAIAEPVAEEVPQDDVKTPEVGVEASKAIDEEAKAKEPEVTQEDSE